MPLSKAGKSSPAFYFTLLLNNVTHSTDLRDDMVSGHFLKKG